MGQVKAIITDFDGTLVDTIIANCYAYSKSFEACGLELDTNLYKENYDLIFCFISLSSIPIFLHKSSNRKP